jgi:uncharacterized protein YbaP (TraB family)
MLARIDRRFARVHAAVGRAALHVLCLLVTQGLPSPTRAADAAPERPAVGHPDEAGRRGFLYEVVRPASAGHPERRLFLYGTIHVGRADVEPFNRPLVDALHCSARIALEADPSQVEAVQRLALRYGRYAGDDRLGRHVPASLLARVRAYGESNGIPPDRIETFKPWFLANLIVLTRASEAGLDPALGSELHLVGYAHASRVPIVEIEGMEAQLRLLADLPADVQIAELEEALADEAHAALPDDAEALFAVWLSGDAAAGDALADAMHREAGDKPFERYFVETLLDARNRTMADRAEALLDQPGDTFFAVGSLHLFGPAGLLAEFVRRGDRVVDLQERPTDRRCEVDHAPDGRHSR